jgi:UDPglucose 6-dehydrogenase
MKLGVIGAGYVGLVSASCFAELGNEVISIDVDEAKIAALKSGKIPIFEEGLQEICSKNQQEGRLLFSSEISDISDCEALLIAVGTPTNEQSGEANLDFVFAAAENIAQYANQEKPILIILKSTVPVGTHEKVRDFIQEKNPALEFYMVANPEFLSQGTAVADFMKPSRVVIGSDGNAQAIKMCKHLYGRLFSKYEDCFIFTDIASASLAKYASNAFLAMKVAFVNEMADLAEKYTANIDDITRVMGFDERIGSKFLKAGPGFGGSCFPKDTLELQNTATKQGLNLPIINAIYTSNEVRVKNIAQKIQNLLDGEIKGKNIAILGLAFKANTDDVRDSQSIKIIRNLVKQGSNITAYDPMAMRNAKMSLQDIGNIKWADDLYIASKDADIICIMTEWSEFKQIDLIKVKALMAGDVIFDCRNILDSAAVRKEQIKYASIGRGK